MARPSCLHTTGSGGAGVPASVEHDRRAVVVEKGGPLFGGIGDSALLLEHGLETEQILLGGERIQAEALEAAVAMDELTAAPGADLHRTAQFVVFAGHRMAGRADVGVHLQRLVDGGDTVIVIEHNLDVIKTADHIIVLGPEGGDKGGTIVAEGRPEDIVKAAASYTGKYLKPLLEEKNE